MSQDHLLVRRSGDVATVVINRPDQRNAISYDMWSRLPALFAELDADPDVRVVLLTGEGGLAFSSGADIKDFDNTRSTPEKARDYRGRVEGACEALGSLTKPSIAVVRGYCIGGGFELSLCADLRVADDTAQIGLPAAKRGLAVTHTIMGRLMGLAGPGNTSYILLSGRLVSAEEAMRMGLLNAVETPAGLDAYVDQLVSDIAELSPVSHRLHKGVIKDLIEYGPAENVPADRLVRPSESESSEDFREGVRSFLEKRKAQFPGR